MEFFQKAIELDEQAATAYYGAGNIYFNQEQYDEAKNMYELSLKKGMDHSDLFFMLEDLQLSRPTETSYTLFSAIRGIK